MKREANFTTSTLAPYLLAKKLYCNYEVKQTVTDELNWNDKRLLRQCESLLAAQKGGYYWKHSDQDQREKPFDGSHVPPQVGFVVIKYPEFFCLISVEDFLLEREHSKRQSLTSQRAKEIAYKVVI